MDELLNQAYHELIYLLLTHPNKQAINVLQAHSSLVDDDFMQILEHTVTTLNERNCPEDADFLTKLVQQLQEAGGLSKLLEQMPPPPQPQTAPQKPPATVAQKSVTPPIVSPEKQAEAEKLFNQGTEQFKGNQYTAAFQSWQQAFQIYRELQDRQGEVNCLGKLGNVYQSLGQYQQAIACHQQSLGIAREIKYPQAEVNSLSNLGHVCYSIGQYEQALSGYQQALNIAQTIKYRMGEANCLGNLGNVYYVLGKSQESIENYQKAVEIAQDMNYRFGAVNFLSHLGNVYASIAQYEEAIAHLDQALSLARTLNYRFGETNFLKNIGKIYQLKADPKQAIVYFEQYLDVARKIKSRQLEANALHDLASASQSLGELEQALAYQQESLEIYRQIQNSDGEATALNQLGQIYQALQQQESATQAFQDSLKIATPKTLPMECISVGSHLGELGFQTQNWELAIFGYNQAIQACENLYTPVTPAAIRVEMQQESTRISAKLVEACIHLKFYDKALEFVERYRCQRQVDLMPRSLSSSEEIQSKVEFYYRLKQQVQSLYWRRQSDDIKQLTTAGVRLNSAATLKAENELLDKLESEQQKVLEEIQSLDVVLARQLEANFIKFDQIQELVQDEKTALLSFYSTDENTYIFLLGSEGVQVQICEGQGIKTLQKWLAENWLKPYQDNPLQWRSQMIYLLPELAERLQLNPLIHDALQNCDELIIIPYLNLHYIPFSALPISSENQSEYLCDRFRIRVFPSCKTLYYSQQQEEISEKNIGIIEDGTGNLVLSNYEAEKLVDLCQVPEERHLTSEQATLKNFEKILQDVQILYSAQLVHCSSIQPLNSGICLGDGNLSQAEILTWRLPEVLELFFPYCKIDLNPLEMIDVPLTVFSSFLDIGVRRVVCSLWLLEDIATSIFIQLYCQYSQEYSYSEALRQAQIKLRQLTGEDLETLYRPTLNTYLAQHETLENPQKINDYRTLLTWQCQQEFPFKSPYYWAGFMVYG